MSDVVSLNPVVQVREVFESLPDVLRVPIEMVVFGGELPRADISQMRWMAEQLRDNAAALGEHAEELKQVLAQQTSVGQFGDQVRGALHQQQDGAVKLGEQASALADQAAAAANEAEKHLCVMFVFAIDLAWLIFRMVAAGSAAGPAGQATAAAMVQKSLVQGRTKVELMRAGLRQAYERIAAATAARMPQVGPAQFAVTVAKAAAFPAAVDASVQGLQVAAGHRDASLMGRDGTNPTGIDLMSVGLAAVAGAAGAAGGMFAARFAPTIFPAMHSSRILTGLVHGTAGAVSGLGATALITGWPQHYQDILAPLLNGGFAGAVYARAGTQPQSAMTPQSATPAPVVDGSGSFVPQVTGRTERGQSPSAIERPSPVKPISEEARQTWDRARAAWASAPEPIPDSGTPGATPVPGATGTMVPSEPGSPAHTAVSAPRAEAAIPTGEPGPAGIAEASGSSEPAAAVRRDDGETTGHTDTTTAAGQSDTSATAGPIDAAPRPETAQTARTESTGATARVEPPARPGVAARVDPPGTSRSESTASASDARRGASESGESRPIPRVEAGGETAPPSRVPESSSARAAFSAEIPVAGTPNTPGGENTSRADQPSTTAGATAKPESSVTFDSSIRSGDRVEPSRTKDDPTPSRDSGEDRASGGDGVRERLDEAGTPAVGRVDDTGDGTGEPGRRTSEAGPPQASEAADTPTSTSREKAEEVLADFHARSAEHIPEQQRLSNLPDEAVRAALFHGNEQDSLIAGMEIIRRQTTDEVPGGMVLRSTQLEGAFELAAGRPVQMLPGQGKTLMFMSHALHQAVHKGSVLLVTTADGLAHREVAEYRRVLEPYGIDVLRADQETGFGQVTPGRPAIVVATGETVGHLCNAGHKPPRSVVIDEMDAIVDRGEKTFIRSESGSEAAPEATVREAFEAHDFLADALAQGQLSHEDFGLRRIGEEVDVALPDGTPGIRTEYWYDGQATLTSGGRERVEALPGGQRWLEGMGLSRLETAAAAEFTTRDKTHYVIDKGKVVIIDQVEHGLQRNPKTSSETRWSAQEGKASLAQAVEAKEIRNAEARGVDAEQHKIVVRADTDSTKSITAAEIYGTDRFFDHVSGASGTLTDLSSVLQTVYRLDTPHEVAPYNPSRLVEGMPDVHIDTRAKLNALAEHAHSMWNGGDGRFQEILCHRNDLVEKQVNALLRAGVPRDAIEAVDANRIAEWGASWETQLQNVFDAAGEQGKILVINRQGQRGVDISVSDAVLAQGGMHVWMTEVPEQSYIYDQAKNRTARNGQPGTAQALMSPQDTLIRDAMHLRGVREAVVYYERAVTDHHANPSAETHNTVLRAGDALGSLVPGLQERAHHRTTTDFLLRYAPVTEPSALISAMPPWNPNEVELDGPRHLADRTTRLAGLLGVSPASLAAVATERSETHATEANALSGPTNIGTDESRTAGTRNTDTLTAGNRTDNSPDPLHELLRQADLPAAAVETLQQQLDATAPGEAARYTRSTDEQALAQLIRRRDRLATELGWEIATIEGAEGLRHLGTAATAAQHELAQALRTASERGPVPGQDFEPLSDNSLPTSEITIARAREILGEAVVGDPFAGTVNHRPDTGPAVVDPLAENVLATDVVDAAARYLATTALLDLVTAIHRRSPLNCVNNGVTAMRVLFPGNADRFRMPGGGIPLKGHDWNTVWSSFRDGSPRSSASIDAAVEPLRQRPGGAQVLVYKWKNTENQGSTDADNHLVLLVNDSTDPDRPNLVAVDLAASRDGNHDHDFGPADLADRRAMLNRAVPFDTWRNEQQPFIQRLPEPERAFWTIDFDSADNPAPGLGPRDVDPKPESDTEQAPARALDGSTNSPKLPDLSRSATHTVRMPNSVERAASRSAQDRIGAHATPSERRGLDQFDIPVPTGSTQVAPISERNNSAPASDRRESRLPSRSIGSRPGEASPPESAATGSGAPDDPGISLPGSAEYGGLSASESAGTPVDIGSRPDHICPPDSRVIARHIDAAGVARYLMVKDEPADTGRGLWRLPTAREAAELNVQVTASPNVTEPGVSIAEASTSSDTASGSRRIADVEWLTAGDVECRMLGDLVDGESARSFEYIEWMFERVPPPPDSATAVAQYGSYLSLNSDIIQRLSERMARLPDSDQDKIAASFHNIVNLVEGYRFEVEMYAKGEDAERREESLRKQQISAELAAHPDIVDLLTVPMSSNILLRIANVNQWNGVAIGELVEFLRSAPIATALRAIHRNNPHFEHYVVSRISNLITSDRDRIGHELERVAEIPADVVDSWVLRGFAWYKETDSPALPGAELSGDKAWDFLLTLEDFSRPRLRQQFADLYLEAGRIATVPENVTSAVSFTAQRLREVEDIYLTGSRSEHLIGDFVRYMQLVAEHPVSQRSPAVRTAMELVNELTPEFVRCVRDLMTEGTRDTQRDVLVLRNTGDAAGLELKEIARSFVTEVKSGVISSESLAKVQSSEFLVRLLNDVTGFGASGWGSTSISRLRELLAVHTGKVAAGRVTAMPPEYRASDVVEVAKLRSRDVDSGPLWTEDLLTRFARLSANLHDARAALAGGRRPFTELIGQLGRDVVAYVEALERSIAAGTLGDGSPMNDVARRKIEVRVRELKGLVAPDADSVHQFPALRSLHDFERNFQRLARVRELHDQLRTICFAWAMHKHPQWIDRLASIRPGEPTLDDVGNVRDFVEHITNQEVFAQYFSNRKAANTFRRMTSAIALDEAILRTQGVGVSDDVTRLRFVPTRGPLIELSGHISDACWADKYESIAAAMPNMVAVMIVRNPDDLDRVALAGAALLIETTSSTGEPVLLVRGLNPLENYINHVSVADFYDQFTAWAQEIAAARGRRLAIVIDDRSGGAATNRPALYGHLVRQRQTLTPIRVDPSDSTFNSYDVSRHCYLIQPENMPRAEQRHGGLPEPDGRIGSRPSPETGGDAFLAREGIPGDRMPDRLPDPASEPLPDDVIAYAVAELTVILRERLPREQLTDPELVRGIHLAAEGLVHSRSLHGPAGNGRAGHEFDDALEPGGVASHHPGRRVADDLRRIVDNGVLRGARLPEIVAAMAAGAWSGLISGAGPQRGNSEDSAARRAAQALHDRALSRGCDGSMARLLGFAVHSAGFDAGTGTRSIASSAATEQMRQHWGEMTDSEFDTARRVGRWVAAADPQMWSEPDALVVSLESALGDSRTSWFDRSAFVAELRDEADFVHPDTGYRVPEGWLLANRGLRRDHATKLREIADRLASDHLYQPQDAIRDARLHAAEMREEYSGFRWQAVAFDSGAALALLPESERSVIPRAIAEALPRVEEIARDRAGAAPVVVVTSEQDLDGRPRLTAQVEYFRQDHGDPDPGVRVDALRREIIDPAYRIDVETSDPTPQGRIWYRLRITSATSEYDTFGGSAEVNPVLGADLSPTQVAGHRAEDDDRLTGHIGARPGENSDRIDSQPGDTSRAEGEATGRPRDDSPQQTPQRGKSFATDEEARIFGERHSPDSSDHRRLASLYITEGTAINRYLRGDQNWHRSTRRIGTTDEMDHLVAEIDAHMRPLSESIRITRKVDPFAVKVTADLQDGDVWPQPAYLSGSTGPEPASYHAHLPGTLDLLVPQGTPVWFITNGGVPEIVVGRGQDVFCRHVQSDGNSLRITGEVTPSPAGPDTPPTEPSPRPSSSPTPWSTSHLSAGPSRSDTPPVVAYAGGPAEHPGGDLPDPEQRSPSEPVSRPGTDPLLGTDGPAAQAIRDLDELNRTLSPLLGEDGSIELNAAWTARHRLEEFLDQRIQNHLDTDQGREDRRIGHLRYALRQPDWSPADLETIGDLVGAPRITVGLRQRPETDQEYATRLRQIAWGELEYAEFVLFETKAPAGRAIEEMSVAAHTAAQYGARRLHDDHEPAPPEARVLNSAIRATVDAVTDRTLADWARIPRHDTNALIRELVRGHRTRDSVLGKVEGSTMPPTKMTWLVRGSELVTRRVFTAALADPSSRGDIRSQLAQAYARSAAQLRATVGGEYAKAEWDSMVAEVETAMEAGRQADLTATATTNPAHEEDRGDAVDDRTQSHAATDPTDNLRLDPEQEATLAAAIRDRDEQVSELIRGVSDLGTTLALHDYSESNGTIRVLESEFDRFAAEFERQRTSPSQVESVQHDLRDSRLAELATQHTLSDNEVSELAALLGTDRHRGLFGLPESRARFVQRLRDEATLATSTDAMSRRERDKSLETAIESFRPRLRGALVDAAEVLWIRHDTKQTAGQLNASLRQALGRIPDQAALAWSTTPPGAWTKLLAANVRDPHGLSVEELFQRIVEPVQRLSIPGPGSETVSAAAAITESRVIDTIAEASVRGVRDPAHRHQVLDAYDAAATTLRHARARDDFDTEVDESVRFRERVGAKVDERSEELAARIVAGNTPLWSPTSNLRTVIASGAVTPVGAGHGEAGQVAFFDPKGWPETDKNSAQRLLPLRSAYSAEGPFAGPGFGAFIIVPSAEVARSAPVRDQNPEERAVDSARFRSDSSADTRISLTDAFILPFASGPQVRAAAEDGYGRHDSAATHQPTPADLVRRELLAAGYSPEQINRCLIDTGGRFIAERSGSLSPGTRSYLRAAQEEAERRIAESGSRDADTVVVPLATTHHEYGSTTERLVVAERRTPTASPDGDEPEVRYGALPGHGDEPPRNASTVESRTSPLIDGEAAHRHRPDQHPSDDTATGAENLTSDSRPATPWSRLHQGDNDAPAHTEGAAPRAPVADGDSRPAHDLRTPWRPALHDGSSSERPERTDRTSSRPGDTVDPVATFRSEHDSAPHTLAGTGPREQVSAADHDDATANPEYAALEYSRELWQRITRPEVPPTADPTTTFRTEREKHARDLRGSGQRFPDSDSPTDTGASGLRVVASAPHHDLNIFLARYAYRDDGGWTGGDSTYIRRLPDGRHVIMFSDTFLGTVRPDGSRSSETPFVSNSFVVVDPDGTARTVLGSRAGDAARAVVPPDGDQFHWLGGSHVTSRNTLDVMFLGFTSDARVDPSAVDFDAARLRAALTPGGNGEPEHRRNLLVRFDIDGLTPIDITPMPSRSGVHWAGWVEHNADENRTYVYGVNDEGTRKHMHIARVLGDDLRRPWEFLDESGGWSPRERDSAPVISGVANEFSVTRLPDGRHLLVTQDGRVPFSPDIVGYVSDSPTGPFTSPTLLYRAPEPGPLGLYGDGEVVMYNAHEQPDLRRGNELTITYNLNGSVPGVLADSSKYRPTAVKVRLDLPEVSTTDAGRSEITEPESTGERNQIISPVREMAGLPADSEQPDVRVARVREMRQLDDINENLGHPRWHGTERSDDGSASGPQRHEPSNDVPALLDQVRNGDAESRLVIGGGHFYRPAEAGEVFLDRSAQAQPDILADAANMSMIPDSTFQSVHFERVEWARDPAVAAETFRVTEPGGNLLITTGTRDTLLADDRNRILNSLRKAGFEDVDVVIRQRDLLDSEYHNSDWLEISAHKPRLSVDDPKEQAARPAHSAEKYARIEAEEITDTSGDNTPRAQRSIEPVVSFDRLNELRLDVDAIEEHTTDIFTHTSSVARYRGSNGNEIWYSAVDHSFNPEHTQYPLIRRSFDLFSESSDSENLVVISEALPVGEKLDGLTFDEAVKEYANDSIEWLARRAGIEVVPAQMERNQHILVLHPSQEELYHLYEFLLSAASIRRNGNSYTQTEAITEIAVRMDRKERQLRTTGIWPREGGPTSATIADALEWHQKHLGIPYSLERDVIPFLTPNSGDTPVNRYSRYRNNYREDNILRRIFSKDEEGKDVFVQMGASHYILQKKILDERFGEPLVYRAGQLSGRLLRGEVIPIGELRAAAIDLERRIARTPDRIRKDRLTEELTVARHELQRAA